MTATDLAGGASAVRRQQRARTVALAGLLAGVLLLTGCTQLLSIDEDALVVGVGLDVGPTPGTVATTLQWLRPAPSGGGGGGAAAGGGGGAGDAVPRTLTAAGPDAAAAVAGIQARMARHITFAVTHLVLLGEPLARRGVGAPLDYFWRTGDFSELAQVAVVPGSPATLLDAPLPRGAAFTLYARLVRSQYSAVGFLPMPLWRFMALTHTPYAAAWAPMIEPTRTAFRAAGTALFVGDRLVGALNEGESSALSWILDGGGYPDLILPTLRAEGEPMALRVRSRAVRMTVDRHGDATLQMRLDTDIGQGPGVVLLNRTSPNRLEEAAGRQATQDVEAMVQHLQAVGADALGLGERLRERDPAAVDNWPATFRRMHIRVQVTVRVVSAGREA